LTYHAWYGKLFDNKEGEVMERYSFGDILWCDRTFEGSDIIPHHEEGPYIVLNHCEGGIYVIKGTGCADDKTRWGENLYLLPTDTIGVGEAPALRKETKFKIAFIKFMPEEFVIRKLGCLCTRSAETLKKHMLVEESYNKFNLSEMNIELDVEYRFGDIIDSGSGDRYLIIDHRDQDRYLVIPYFNDTYQTRFNYDFDKAVYVNKNQTFKLVGSLTESRKKHVDNYFYEFLCNIENPVLDHEINHGSLIICCGTIYYVSTIESGKCLCYKFIKDSTEPRSICLRGTLFHIDFEQVKIDLNHVLARKIYNLSTDEINMIREEKKIDKRVASSKRKSNEKKSRYLRDSSYNFYGKIYYEKGIDSEGYAAYKLLNNQEIECVDLAKLKTGYFETVIFGIDDIEYATRNRENLINYIRSINVTIEDERYEEFLLLNGIFNTKTFGRARKRIQNFKDDSK